MDSIPVEMLLLVGRYLSDKSLSRLARVDRYRYAQLNPVLWQRGSRLSNLSKQKRLPGVLRAIQSGNLDAVRKFFDLGLDANTPLHGIDAQGSMLGNAVKDINSNIEMVKLLLERGADINFVHDQHPTSPFLLAVSRDRHEMLRAFLPYQPNLSLVLDALGRTHCSVCMLLLGRHFFTRRATQLDVPDLPELAARNLLLAACFDGSPDDAEFALSGVRKYDQRVARVLQGSKAMFCAINGKNRTTMEWLIQQGYDPAETPRSGFSALFWALKGRYIEGARLLLDHGARFTSEADGPEWRGRPCVLGAVGSCDVDVLEFAIRQGADPLAHNNGSRALAEAIAPSYPSQNNLFSYNSASPCRQMVEMLLGLGASVDVEDERFCGRNPLHLAVLQGRADIVKLLLANGATADHCIDQEKTPLCMATEDDFTDCMQALLQAGADPTRHKTFGMRGIIYKASSATATELLLKYSSPDHQSAVLSHEGLRCFIRRGEPGVVQVMLDHGIPISNPDAPDSEQPLLFAACRMRPPRESVVGVLLRHPRIPRDQIDKAVDTALARKDVKLLKLLLDQGVDVNRTTNDSHPKTLLQVAAGRNNSRVVRLLLDRGADVDRLGGKSQLSALHLALLSYRRVLGFGGSTIDESNDEEEEEEEEAKEEEEEEEEEEDDDDDYGHAPVLAIDALLRHPEYVQNPHRLNLADAKGRTPLHTAARRLDEHAVRALLLWGADPNIRDHKGRLPEDYLTRLQMKNAAYRPSDEDEKYFLERLISIRENIVRRLRGELVYSE